MTTSDTKLPEWPTKEQYEAAWKGRERGLTNYYMEAAFAAVARLRVAVAVLKDVADNAHTLEDAIGYASEALADIGPLPTVPEDAA